jgi:hypothetical protein
MGRCLRVYARMGCGHAARTLELADKPIPRVIGGTAMGFHRMRYDARCVH